MRLASVSTGVMLALTCGIASSLQAQKPRRASPTLLPGPSAPAPAAAPRPDSAAPKASRPSPTLANRPGVAVDSSRTAARNAATAQTVAPQAARPAGPAPARPAPVAAFSAGLAIEAYAGESDEDRDRYVARFTQQLDSAIATLVGVFRGTTGQPLAGAESPAALSQRERERWSRCRDLHFDLQSYGDALRDFTENLPEEPPVQRAAAALDTALTALHATSACDDVSSMIAAPDRWTPWASQYQATTRTFYRDWYSQVREAADRNRALVLAINATRPAAGRMPVPPGLARTPPYAGAGPH